MPSDNSFTTTNIFYSLIDYLQVVTDTNATHSAGKQPAVEEKQYEVFWKNDKGMMVITLAYVLFITDLLVNIQRIPG